ncbi:MAG: hypothetical protein AAB849_02905 [Patescibacteria group bacterium]
MPVGKGDSAIVFFESAMTECRGVTGFWATMPAAGLIAAKIAERRRYDAPSSRSNPGHGRVSD